jgi:hypothetical protein
MPMATFQNHETVKRASNSLFLSMCWLVHAGLKQREIGCNSCEPAGRWPWGQAWPQPGPQGRSGPRRQRSNGSDSSQRAIKAVAEPSSAKARSSLVRAAASERRANKSRMTSTKATLRRPESRVRRAGLLASGSRPRRGFHE